MRVLISAILILLLFGCAGKSVEQSSPTPEPTQNLSNDTYMNQPSCMKYCSNQTNDCNGSWSASGNYPNCNCKLVCKEKENISEPVSNQSYQPASDDRSPSEILTDALKKISDDFYSDHQGSFNQKTYSWELSPPPNDGSLSYSSYGDVKFTNKTIKSIQNSGFILFTEKESSTETIYGVAVFYDKTTILDDLSTYDVSYSPVPISKILHKCATYTKDYNIDSNDKWSVTYYFKCNSISDKE